MASAAGIHIDQNSFRLIALDGSPKKHKLAASIEGVIEPGEDPVAAVAEALRQGAKEHKLDVETVGLVVDSGLAAFRSLTLPFDDESKIEEVLKFEIESELPQWNIDDVVVDYVTVQTKPGVQSDLLVTAVPKDRLQLQIEACEAAGLEPNEAELDGTALFNAASGSGLLREDAAQLLVHVGDASTALVLCDGGRLISMRALRAGAGPQAPAEGEEEAAPASPRTVQRVRREILRTLSGAKLENPLDEVLLAGHEMAGLSDETFEGAPARRLRIELTSGDSALPTGFEVAYGAALRELGSDALRPSLRREELRYSGKFERLELPLAVLGLLLVTALAVQFITIQKKVDWHERDMRTWMQSSNNFLFPDPTAATPYAGRLKSPPDAILNFAKQSAAGEIGTMTGYEQLLRVRDLLRDEKSQLEIDVGTKTDYEQPLSALGALMLVTQTIDGLGDGIGRYALRSVTASYVQGRAGNEDYVQVKLDMDFHAADSTTATENYSVLRNAFEDKGTRPWCLDFKSTSSDPFDDGKGLVVNGISIEVNPKLARKAEG